MQSLIRALFESQDVTAEDTFGTAVFPQRIRDEKGAIQVTLNQDPGGTPLGEIYIEGRLRSDLTYRKLASVPFSAADLNTAPFSLILSGIDIVPDMRAATRDAGSGYSVAAGTTATVLLME